MSEIKYIQVSDPEDKFLEGVEFLFEELYEYVKDKGQQNHLVEGGGKLWMNSVKRSLNKLGAIIIALDNNQVVGFIHGSIRFLPDFLGAEKSGFVAHHYILRQYRGRKVGITLLKLLEDWFLSKGVTQVEAYVNVGNINSRKYFERNGYTHELVQLRKFLDETKNE